MNSNIVYNQAYVLTDENTPGMIPDADGLVSITTLLCPGEASVPATESISKEYDELPLISLDAVEVFDPAHEAMEDDYDLGLDCSEEMKALADKIWSQYYDEEDLDADD